MWWIVAGGIASLALILLQFIAKFGRGAGHILMGLSVVTAFLLVRGVFVGIGKVIKSAEGIKGSARELTGPAQYIFKRHTMPTLAKFYGRFNRQPPTARVIARINGIASGTAALIQLVIVIVFVVFVISAIRGAIEAW